MENPAPVTDSRSGPRDFLKLASSSSFLPLSLPAFTQMRTDEEGKSARVRRPLIGFKRCEVALDIDGINNGLYDAMNGNTDLRLHDGCRYGNARIRISNVSEAVWLLLEIGGLDMVYLALEVL